MSDRNVVLTGFMGTGKTTVGRVVADRLGFRFVDTDALIEERHGPIPQIFAEHGEGRFRQLEREVANELATQRGLVIGTGGRLMLDAVNEQHLASSGDVVCLHASLDTIMRRVDGDGAGATRPLLAGDDVRTRVAGLLAERLEGYGRFVQVDTDDLTPDEVADRVIDATGRRTGR